MFLIPLFLIPKINGFERDLEKAPILIQSGSYASLSTRAMTPDLPLEQQTVEELKRRKTTLLTAISIKDVVLAKSSFEKDFSWVNTLYLRQRYADNHIPQTTHQELQEKFIFARALFTEIDTAIAEEEARQEWLRKLSAPGAFDLQCCAQEADCCSYWPQWINVAGTVLVAGMALLYGIGDQPSRLATYDPCRILPNGQQAQMFLDCEQSSMNTSIPCVILNPHNATQIRLMEDCCASLVEAFCLKNITYYNDHVYPRQMWNAWRPTAIIFPSIVALQIAFQLGGCWYRKSKRLREPIKQLMNQKKTDFAQIQQDFSKLEVVDDSSFQEL